jgi:hypothetical protein
MHNGNCFTLLNICCSGGDEYDAADSALNYIKHCAPRRGRLSFVSDPVLLDDRTRVIAMQVVL